MSTVAETSLLIASPVGPLRLVARERSIVRIAFVDEPPGVEAHDAAAEPVLAEARSQLRAYFAGTLKRFDLPLGPEGTPFELSVWRALVEIPFGETRTYASIAAALGRPGAARAVGAANARNPVAIVIPCHRVVGADGTLTGYAGGLPRKRRLLEHEGALPRGERQLGLDLN